MCCLCGRRLTRAAATIPAGPDHPPGAVGPSCARRAGLLAPPRPALFSLPRRQARRQTAASAGDLFPGQP